MVFFDGSNLNFFYLDFLESSAISLLDRDQSFPISGQLQPCYSLLNNGSLIYTQLDQIFMI